VSELLLFNSNSAILQLYYGENKLIFNEMIMMMMMRVACTRPTPGADLGYLVRGSVSR
jgi:hypothetical protein